MWVSSSGFSLTSLNQTLILDFSVLPQPFPLYNLPMAPSMKGQSYDFISPCFLLLFKRQRIRADDLAHKTLDSIPSTAKQNIREPVQGARGCSWPTMSSWSLHTKLGDICFHKLGSPRQETRSRSLREDRKDPIFKRSHGFDLLQILLINLMTVPEHWLGWSLENKLPKNPMPLGPMMSFCCELANPSVLFLPLLLPFLHLPPIYWEIIYNPNWPQTNSWSTCLSHPPKSIFKVSCGGTLPLFIRAV